MCCGWHQCLLLISASCAVFWVTLASANTTVLAVVGTLISGLVSLVVFLDCQDRRYYAYKASPDPHGVVFLMVGVVLCITLGGIAASSNNGDAALDLTFHDYDVYNASAKMLNTSLIASLAFTHYVGQPMCIYPETSLERTVHPLSGNAAHINLSSAICGCNTNQQKNLADKYHCGVIKLQSIHHNTLPEVRFSLLSLSLSLS
jgi:hypothetical protein